MCSASSAGQFSNKNYSPKLLQDAVLFWHSGHGTSSDDNAPGAGEEKETVPPGDKAEAYHSYRKRSTAGIFVLQRGRLDAPKDLLCDSKLAVKEVSLGIRLCDPSGRFGSTILAMGDVEEKGVFKLYAEKQSSEMDLLFEMRMNDAKYQVGVPTYLIGPTDWHNVIIRYNGLHLEMYVDGVLVHHHGSARGQIVVRDRIYLVIGGEWDKWEIAHPFSGVIDYVAIWNRALKEAEIIALSGGEDVVSQRRQEIAKALKKAQKILEARAASDPHRPQYHFVPPANWMNDPNGLIFWKGKYHLFYQHNPYGPYWGTIHWGHALSKDMVHWKHLPIALAPTPDGPDKDGCFSGCAVTKNGIPTILYTGVYPEVQCLATGSDDLVRWDKYPKNPVIPSPPPGVETTGFRDPWVWEKNDTWYMIIGSGIKNVGGILPLYRSKDLVEWEYMHPLYAGDPQASGARWECPSFVPLGDKYVLIVSAIPLSKAIYFVGTYRNHKFSPEQQGVLDIGEDFYAPQVLIDAKGRRVIMGWLREARSEKAQRQAGWAGVQSLPRVLTLLPDGRLGMEPLPELKTLRSHHYQFADLNITPQSHDVLPDIRGSQLELLAEFEPGDAKTFGLKVRRAPEGKEETLILYNSEAKELIVDRRRSSLNPEVHNDAHGGSFVLAEGETLTLNIFIDRSVIEIFANKRTCLTMRVYPCQPESAYLDLFAEGGTATLKSLDVWVMKSIWSKRGQNR